LGARNPKGIGGFGKLGIGWLRQKGNPRKERNSGWGIRQKEIGGWQPFFRRKDGKLGNYLANFRPFFGVGTKSETRRGMFMAKR